MDRSPLLFLTRQLYRGFEPTLYPEYFKIHLSELIINKEEILIILRIQQFELRIVTILIRRLNSTLLAVLGNLASYVTNPQEVVNMINTSMNRHLRHVDMNLIIPQYRELRNPLQMTILRDALLELQD